MERTSGARRPPLQLGSGEEESDSLKEKPAYARKGIRMLLVSLALCSRVRRIRILPPGSRHLGRFEMGIGGTPSTGLGAGCWVVPWSLEPTDDEAA